MSTARKQLWDAYFQRIADEAHAAGMAALNACTPTPMIVGSPSTPFGSDVDPSKPTYFVEGGVCGFAWVKLKGNTKFGRWAKKTGLARDDYPSGLYISAREGGQSMQRKEAYAGAYARHLRDNGIDAWMSSRMD